MRDNGLEIVYRFLTLKQYKKGPSRTAVKNSKKSKQSVWWNVEIQLILSIRYRPISVNIVVSGDYFPSLINDSHK